MVVEGIELWLQRNMARRGIKSARRLAIEADLDLVHVCDWLVGRGQPTDDEVIRLARFFGQSEIETRREINQVTRRLVA